MQYAGKTENTRIVFQPVHHGARFHRLRRAPHREKPVKSYRRILTLAVLFAAPAVAPVARAADAPHPAAPATRPAAVDKPAYPVPYTFPERAQIVAALDRVLGYLDQAMPARVVDRKSGQPVTDFSNPAPDAIADRGDADAFRELDYTVGVTHAGMLLATEVTGDPKYAAFTARHLQFIADRIPYFRAHAQKFGYTKDNFGPLFEPKSLDDCGAVCAALIKARRANVGPDLQPVVDTWIDFVHTKQFRLADGTLARHRPQAESLWADDFYMSIPALAQMGKLTGDARYTDDAAKQVLQLSKYLFNPDKGLYMHGRNLNQPDNPEFYWGRANGWAMMANVELLDVLPPDHPAREDLLKILRAHIKAIAPLQSGSGLWHQMLDKPDSYEETSASAMFVFSIARAINRGWISPVSYGAVAQAGWNGLTTRINARGQVEGTCVATTFASDNVYYYNRPASPYATHGYGPVLLAGAEILRLVQNPALEVQDKHNTFHYVPKPTPAAQAR
jgi:rhamnogalacturonyl hydrolase YesR